MSTTSGALPARIAGEYAEASRTLPAAIAAAPRRRTALAALATGGLPAPRDENWKYANLRPLERQRFVPAAPAAANAAPAAGGAGDIPLADAAAVTAALPPPVAGFARYVFIDGRFAPAHSAVLDAAPASITTLARAAAHGPAPTGAATQRAADERLALLNDAFAPDGAVIRVSGAGRSAGALAHPPADPARIEVLFVASADLQLGASYPRLEVTLGALAHCVLIERHLSVDERPGFVNGAVALELAPGASLTHYRMQDLSERSFAYDTLTARLARDASLRLHAMSLGAQSARSTLAVELAGERAELVMAVGALGDGRQVQDTYARVAHLAPRTATVQTFRGIAAARARVAFNGKIVVAETAAGADSRQSLRGLLAGPDAEIDLRPQLEIHTDEVRCTHGATAGKLDEGMLFYLVSRGIDRAMAERLLKRAFLADVLAAIAVPELRAQVEIRCAGRLEASRFTDAGSAAVGLRGAVPGGSP